MQNQKSTTQVGLSKKFLFFPLSLYSFFFLCSDDPCNVELGCIQSVDLTSGLDYILDSPIFTGNTLDGCPWVLKNTGAAMMSKIPSKVSTMSLDFLARRPFTALRAYNKGIYNTMVAGITRALCTYQSHAPPTTPRGKGGIGWGLDIFHSPLCRAQLNG